jgi:nitroimidazol reductase NimA-like FMN-containing flavoprotein (pyridoxamine 5'-phosphate oxidase superfamily)
MNKDQAWERLRRLLHGQPLGVLATSAANNTHAALVAFVASDDLHELVFATSRATRKFRSLQENSNASLLVDDRRNDVRDFRDACAVTAHGRAAMVDSGRLQELRDRYIQKHPHLEDFVRSPSCALIRIVVESYDLVGNFQEVHTLRMGNEPPSPD